MKKLYLLSFLFIYSFLSYSQTDCSSAVTVEENTNYTKTLIPFEYQWYKFTMPQDGKLQITWSNSENAQIELLSGDCNNLQDEGGGLGLISYLEGVEGEELIIRLSTFGFSNQDIDFTLEVNDVVQGDFCDDPILAVENSEGVNTVSSTLNQYIWFQFQMPSEAKKVRITNPLNTEIELYAENCTTFKGSNLFSQEGDFVTINPQPNEIINVRFTLDGEGDFDWNLSFEDFQTGEKCDLAAAASTGINSIPDSEVGYYWYSYTMPSEGGRLNITSSVTNNVQVVSNGCSLYEVNGSGFGNTYVSNLAPNDEVLIRWDLRDGNNFDWDLSTEPFVDGDLCSSAQAPQLGDNVLPEDNYADFWYSFTVQEDNTKILIDTDNFNVTYQVYSGDCNSLIELVANGFQNEEISGLSVNEEIFIRWNINDTESLTWNFDYFVPVAGETCENAAIPVEGVNTIPATSESYFWYRYTMPELENQKLEIVAEDGKDISIYNAEDACSNFGSSIYNSDGAIRYLNETPGEELLIRIQTNGGNFDFEFNVEEVEAGDSCNDPKIANEGINTTEIAEEWFEFTVPRTGDYVISSVGFTLKDTFLRLYSNCSRTVIDLNDDFDGSYQSQVNLELIEGERIFILWDNIYNAEGFDWEIDGPGLDQTISFNSLDSKTFGDPDFELEANSSSELPISYSSSNTEVATVNGTTVTIVGTGTTTITATQDGNDDYNPAEPVEQSLTVEKANQSITFDAIADKEVADPDFTIPASVNSGLDLTFDVSGPAIVSGNTLSLTGETGTVSITASQAGNDNYNAAEPATIEFLVTDPAKTNQTITFEELDARTYGVLGINLNGTSSSGLSLTYESSNPSVATIEGNLVVVNTAGTTTITASQEGDATFNPAEPVSRELVINKADQTITVSAIGDKEVTDEPFDVEATVSSGLQLSYAVEGPATISGNTLTLGEKAGTVTVTVSQAGNVNYNSASESVSFDVSNPRSDQTISITAIADKFTNDDPFEVEASTTSELALTYEVSGPATIEGTTITLDGTTGTVEITVSQAGNNEFNPASETISFEVTEDPCLDFTATATTNAVSCAGSADGTITVETTEGTAPFSYSLAGAEAVENNEFIELEAGEYTVEVTDANGCSATVIATITSPDALEITAEVENSNSINGNGSITLTVSGGTGDYTYSWSNEATTSSLEELEVGEYTVTVTDESGCTIEESFTIGGITANEEALTESLLIFPNPAKDVVQLQHSENAKSLKLYDAMGKLLKEIVTEGQRSELNVSQLPSGLYFIRQDGDSQLYRFVKE